MPNTKTKEKHPNQVFVNGFEAVVQGGDETYVHLWLSTDKDISPVFSLMLLFDCMQFKTNDRVSHKVFDDFVKTLNAEEIKEAVWDIVKNTN